MAEKKRQVEFALQNSVGHPNAAAIRAHPGGAIGNSPHIFLKTGLTDLEATGAVETIRHLFFAALALIVFLASTPSFFLHFTHGDGRSSFSSQLR